MKTLLITGCSDRLLWYSGMIGKTIPLIREYHDCYMSREPEGYANIVKKCDAQIIEATYETDNTNQKTTITDETNS